VFDRRTYVSGFDAEIDEERYGEEFRQYMDYQQSAFSREGLAKVEPGVMPMAQPVQVVMPKSAPDFSGHPDAMLLGPTPARANGPLLKEEGA
jgi:hypothetical protein